MNKRFALITLALAGALAVGGLATSQTAKAPADTAWEQVHRAYAAARDQGDSSQIDQALSLADAYVQQHAGDGRALTYRGSLAAMRARVSWAPWKKLGLLNEGVGQMDDGIALVLKHNAGTAVELDSRMVRGITSAHIPRTFGRGSVAAADFRAIIAHPLFSQIAPAHQATALAWLAVLQERAGQNQEATQLRQQAKALDPQVAQNIWNQAS